MIESLNHYEGLIALISLIATIVIAIIGYFINKNISQISQSQNIKKNSKGLQSGRDAIDRSINFKS